ncbi:MAG: DNA-directed RNA polymerase subunit A' [Nanoarchaeota archaeon]|nr:DNA-directed RNA polymerase subunit A' [Nanoarchaeota archaeon]
MPEEEKNQNPEETEPETVKTGAISGDLVAEEYIERVEGYEQYVYKKVRTITFGILSPVMIKKMASAKVVTPELYDREGYPVDGGLMDIRLGVIDPGLKCKTCGSKLKECIGHFGYIELARPIIHIKYANIILNILRCTCRECGKTLINPGSLEKYIDSLDNIEKTQGIEARRVEIKKMITELRTVSKCPHCKAKQFKVTIEKPTTFLEDEKRISPIEIRTRLEKVPDEGLLLFGLDHNFVRPEWMVLTVLSIPPVTMRPSITLESGERSEDDLTHKLGDIVRINQRLFENINAGAPEIIIEDLWDLLQYHITTFFDNNIAQLPPARHRSGQPLKTITERITSKQGRIRHNLAGKRTNFSGRTVISPDPKISINEVGVPKEMAMKLTVPERINEWNLAYLKKFIENGNQKYPGANYIIRPDGKKKKITEETKEAALEEIQPGYSVERHLLDGDIALFNRQPSLHRMSMMCHYIRVLPGKTLRLNPSVCNPYNADFDGDEMNLHIPQTEEARAEAEELMLVEKQIISPRYGLSVIGCIQDSISGNFVLTRDMEFDKQDAIDILYSIGVDDFSRFPNKAKISGKDMFSMVLPSDFTYAGRSKACIAPSAKCKECDKFSSKGCSVNGLVEIKKGKLISGVMDSANLGEGKGLMLRQLHKRYGNAETAKILEKMMRLGIAALYSRGFTTGIGDSDVSDKGKEEVEKILAAAEIKVSELIEKFNNNKLETFPGKTKAETLELKILEVLNKARNLAGKIVQDYSEESNHTIIMAKSGARGGPINLAQMAACVGQQAMRGKRIEKGYSGRTLSSFKVGDLGPKARGFIRDGFKKGLKPWEFFFMAMTGRDSLMDTALRTPKSGYLYRRLANAMQDIRVEYDETVRDSRGNVIQFLYGEDGIDVSKSENGVINVKNIIESKISSR